MHAVGSIHAYLSGQVLQSLGSTLEKALTQAENLEEIVTSIKFLFLLIFDTNLIFWFAFIQFTMSI